MFKGKLASDEAVKCYDDVLKIIDDLNEDNAKALLKQVYARRRKSCIYRLMCVP